MGQVQDDLLAGSDVVKGNELGLPERLFCRHVEKKKKAKGGRNCITISKGRWRYFPKAAAEALRIAIREIVEGRPRISYT